MKRKKIQVFLTVALASVMLITAVIASDSKLSPALDIISADCVMVKSAAVGETVRFTAEDFTLSTGIEPSAITVTSLPQKSEGVLKLGNGFVTTGQTISVANLDLLSFVPEDGVNESSFRFTCDRSYSTECKIRITNGVNSAPVSAGSDGIAAVTQADITCFGTLKGSDPDGDALYYEVVTYPTLGIVSVTDTMSGTFTYTPYEGVTGVDSFSYRVRDEYGNYSEVCEVSMSIEPRATEDVLTDMEGHWAHGAALTMIAEGAMDVIAENGKLYFDPDEVITREQYLVTVMKALGAGELPAAKTVFADDDEISKECSGYVAAAYKLGIVKGELSDAGSVFRPTSPISRAEAAVILNRILGAEAEGVVPVFADGNEIPDWAEKDIRALSSIGIFSGSGNSLSPLEHLTRGQTAQILYITKSLYK